MIKNIQKMFDKLFFTLSYEKMVTGIGMNKKAAQQNQQKCVRFFNICETHLEQSTDVLITMISMVLEQKGNSNEDVQNLLISLWFSYLKV